MTVIAETSNSNTFNDEADFWRKDIGVNTIPYDTANVFKNPGGGKPLIKWSAPLEGQKLGLKDRALSNEEFDELKKNNKFKYGIAIIPGKIWHREECKSYFLYVIDIDNAKAMKAFLTTESGEYKSLDDKLFSQYFIIEQHEDNLCKAHLIGYSNKQLKSMSKGGLEVLTEPKHLVNVSPSIHENGYPYVRHGAALPNIPLTDAPIEKHLNNVFKRLGFSYLEPEPATVSNSTISTQNPFAVNEEPILEGSRNNKFYRKCCSLLRKNMGKIPLEDIKILALNHKTRNCKPTPLAPTECETIWKSAVDFITKKVKEEEQEQEQEEDTPPTLEEELTEKYKFKSLKDNDEIYHWDKDRGIYVKNSEWLIKQECMTSDPQMKSKEVNEIINHITWSNYIDRTDLDSQIEWLSMKNGIVNLRTGEIKDHSPDYLTTVQIPHDYKPMPETYKPLLSKDGLTKLSSVDEWEKLCGCKCPCPRIMKFMYQVVAAEDVETVLDFMAYCLWRDFPFHKYLLFNGSGRNGKGVMIALFKKLLGIENISAESLVRLLTNNFAAAKLYGTLANIDSDLSNEALKNTGLLKKLTGDDDIPAEEKYKRPFHFKNYAKLIFSANQIPKTPDETDAFFARLIITNFPNQFLGDKADPWLLQKLTTNEEMDGLLSMVVARLSRVLKSGIYVTNDIVEENRRKYILSSDPIRAFIELAIDTNDKNHHTLVTDVYGAYIRFCSDKKLGVETRQTLTRRLGLQGLVKKQDTNKTGNQPWYWTGVKLKDYAAIEEGQEDLGRF